MNDDELAAIELSMGDAESVLQSANNHVIECEKRLERAQIHRRNAQDTVDTWKRIKDTLLRSRETNVGDLQGGGTDV